MWSFPLELEKHPELCLATFELSVNLHIDHNLFEMFLVSFPSMRQSAVRQRQTQLSVFVN
jgi:hypothetical protein